MVFDELYLVDKIKDSLTFEMTEFNNTWFEFDDTVVSITGRVQQTFGYVRDDYFTKDYELLSRTADFDEILVSNKDGTRYLTIEEIYAIEKIALAMDV